MKKNITNTLEVVTLGAALASAIINSKADGKLDANDLINLVGVVPAIGPALAGIGEVPSELADLDDAEKSVILEKVQSIVGQVGNEKAEAYAVAALKIADGVYDAVKIARS